MKLFRKLFVPVLIVVGLYYAYTEFGSSILNDFSPQARKSTDNVLGTAQKFVSKQASRSADFATAIVLKKATEPLIREFRKLPANQQKVIRKEICE